MGYRFRIAGEAFWDEPSYLRCCWIVTLTLPKSPVASEPVKKRFQHALSSTANARSISSSVT